MRLSQAEARRLAISAQRLAGRRPGGILEAVRETGPLQLDPTNAVARSQLLVLWSRLGAYDVGELDRLLWEERALFQWRAFIYPAEDWPLVSAAARRFPPPDAYGQGINAWLGANDGFRRYVLRELRRRGPLRQDELEDRSVRAWKSTGWTHERNVSQMLEFLGRQGKVLVAGRRGQQRIWDLAERVVPPAPALPAREAARVEVERRARALGIVTRSGARRTNTLWLLPLEEAFDRLVRARVLLPFEVEGLRGTWYAHRDAVGSGRFRGRTTLLSPFDPLVYDRARSEELFGFRYRLEIYVPKAKREYGYFVLPILHGDRLIGRIDPALDRRAGVLHVEAVYAEPDAPAEAGEAVASAIRELAAWLGAGRIAYGRTPPRWRVALRH
jgi:uncharacterized protein YcaQ